MVILQQRRRLLIPSRGLLKFTSHSALYIFCKPVELKATVTAAPNNSYRTENDQSAALKQNKNTGLHQSVQVALWLRDNFGVCENHICHLGVSSQPARSMDTVEFLALCVNLNSKQHFDFSGGQRPLFMLFRTCLFIRKPLRLPCCRGGKINLWQYKPQGLHHGDSFRRAAPTRLGLEINKATPMCIFETEC